MHLVFGLHLRGDPLAFFVGSVLFVLATTAFGVMVGVRVSHQTTAVQVMQLAGFILSFLISGFIFPLSNIPAGLRWLANITPARWYLTIVRDGFLRGGGWPAIHGNILALCVLTLVFSALAWASIRRMQVGG